MTNEESERILATAPALAKLMRLTGDVAKEYHNLDRGGFAFEAEQIDRAKVDLQRLGAFVADMKRNVLLLEERLNEERAGEKSVAPDSSDD